MTEPRDIVARLSARTLAVCRHYLPNGRRQGNFWVVGDVRNTPGHSMYVRLFPDGAGHRAGRWTDAATGEYGDLLDIIQEQVPSRSFSDAVAEAKAFLGNHPAPRVARFRADRPIRSNHVRQAKALFRDCNMISGTLGEQYLINRAIDPSVATGLRFHPVCYCRPTDTDTQSRWPALVVPVTDANDNLTGVHRLYLDPAGLTNGCLGKAPIDKPKRSLGRIHGHAARFGEPNPLIVVAEGIENALSIRTAFPDLTVHAALTAGGLSAYLPPLETRRLLIALDDDAAGRWAADSLAQHCHASDLPVSMLNPRMEDHNHDLRILGLEAFRAALLGQLAA